MPEYLIIYLNIWTLSINIIEQTLPEWWVDIVIGEDKYFNMSIYIYHKNFVCF